LGYENADVGIWMLDKKVDKWGIEPMMETSHIKWCFLFEIWKDLDKVNYAHAVNLKAYKDDPEQVVVFLLVPFLPLQAKIICPISKMDDNLHPKSYERNKFRVAKFLNRTIKLIHQMWDEMVTVIVIEKDNKMVITSKVAKIDVEASLVIRAPKKTKKGGNKEEKGR
jgi:hypothetical protein